MTADDLPSGLLGQVASEVERTRSAAILVDHEWRLMWASTELKALIGAEEPEALGYGKHLLECYNLDPWHLSVSEESRIQNAFTEVPRMLYDTPGGRERIVSILRTRAEEIEAGLEDPRELAAVQAAHREAFRFLEEVEIEEPPPYWIIQFEWLYRDLPPVNVFGSVSRLRDDRGRLLGMLIDYDPGLPGRVLALVARGDEDMFGRMIRLFEPGRRNAAVLFADLQMSTALSRSLPSAAYFQLIRAITTEIDAVVAKRRGIVGKHVGDGVTAFFLADDTGTASRAARNAIESARDVGVAARDAAKAVAEETGLFDPSQCLINVGLHWGDALYMGQLVTGGRLEVTALGDRVNETARIQQTARDGQILASKGLVETLDEDDAAALSIHPDAVLYSALADLPGAGEKAIRDAGAIPVTSL